MVKKYNLIKQGEEKVSKHFKVKEFRSYSNTYNKLFSNEVLISEELVKKLEELRDALGCKIEIINGYRCKEHNAKVGGAKNSTHLLGYAADICCTVSNGIIPAKKVCCIAQDLGFKGIGYMRNNHVHLDMSPTRTWYGDETKKENGTYYSLTKHKIDFYKYFGFEKKKPKNEKDKPALWAVNSWNKAISLGITDGSNPTAYITREQAITILLRKRMNKKITIQNACSYAYEQGYTDGTNLKKYATREHCCTFIYRILSGNNRATLNESIKYCIDKNILRGDGKGYRLKDNCQRQEFIEMLFRYYR